MECSIPLKMREERRWILRSRQKMPVNPRTGKSKAWNNEDDFVTYDEALLRQKKFHAAGLSFVTGNGWCGIDLDHCTWDGETAKGAEMIVQAFGSYAEESVSGSGIHIFVKIDPAKVHLRSDRPGWISLNGKGEASHPHAQIDLSGLEGIPEDAESHVEIYHNGQALTITGKPFGGKAYPVRERTKAVLALIEKKFPEAKERPRVIRDPASFMPRETDHAKVLGALYAINPCGIGYEVWRNIGMAAKASGITYDEFDLWCQGDPAGYNEPQNRAHWRSYDGPERSRWSAGTIFYFAVKDGWEPGRNENGAC